MEEYTCLYAPCPSWPPSSLSRRPARRLTLDSAHLQSLLKEVGEITGLEVKRPVKARTVTRDEWKQWVDDEIRQTVKLEEIRADELALRLFGLIPRDFDLRKATVDLLGEQAAAVYDPRQKLMMVVDGASPEGVMADMVLVHELAHALADQHFDLKRFLEKGAKTGEDQTARLAVVEGQAMWVMLEWQMRRTGSSLKNNRAALDLMLPMMGRMAAEQFPVFSTAPLYMKETLLFPYSAGILFQQSAIETKSLGRVHSGAAEAAGLHPANPSPGSLGRRRTGDPTLHCRRSPGPRTSSRWPAARWANSTCGSCWSSSSPRTTPARSARHGVAEPTKSPKPERAHAPCCGGAFNWLLRTQLRN